MNTNGLHSTGLNHMIHPHSLSTSMSTVQTKTNNSKIFKLSAFTTETFFSDEKFEFSFDSSAKQIFWTRLIPTSSFGLNCKYYDSPILINGSLGSDNNSSGYFTDGGIFNVAFNIRPYRDAFASLIHDDRTFSGYYFHITRANSSIDIIMNIT